MATVKRIAMKNMETTNSLWRWDGVRWSLVRAVDPFESRTELLAFLRGSDLWKYHDFRIAVRKPRKAPKRIRL